MKEVLEAIERAETALKEARSLLTSSSAQATMTVAPSLVLSPADYLEAATRLKVPIATVQAVDDVESGRDGGFDSLGRCTVLFEPHVFSRETGHRFDATHGGVSYSKWKTKPYPTGDEDTRNKKNWDKIEYAAKLDHKAAYRSASYGRFQVMGFNHKICGFDDIDAFVAAMKRSERDHLMAFIAYVEHNDLARHLRNRDWVAFATGYNGEGQAQLYGSRIAAAVTRRGG